MLLKMKKMNLEIDKLISIIGIVVATIFIFVMFDSILNQIILIIPIVLTTIACIIWLSIRKSASLETDGPSSLQRNTILSSLFFIIFTCSVLSINYRANIYERPFSYFILTSLMISITAIEIIYLNIKFKYMVLFQIIVIGVSISWSQLLIFPSVLGVDPWFHQMMTLDIINSHFIPKGFTYSKLPIFHLLVSFSYLLIYPNYKLATMFSVSLTQIISNVIFIYLLGKLAFNDLKIGLLSSLALTITSQHIFMTYWSIPTSLAAIYIPIIIYLVYKLKSEMPVTTTILTLILLTTVILTHSITSSFLAVLLLSLWGIRYIYNFLYDKKGTRFISLNYTILFIVSMFSWWSFVSGHIKTLSRLISWGFSIDMFEGSMPNLFLNTVTFRNVALTEQLFNVIGPYLFYTISFIGCLYMISKYGNEIEFSIVFAGIVPLILAFSSIITEHNIIEERWFYYAQIFLSLPFAAAIFIIANNFKNELSRNLSLTVLFVVLSILLIMSPVANLDNNMFSPESTMRRALTASEMQAYNTISNVWKGTIKTDSYYSSSQRYKYKNTEAFDYEIYYKDFRSLDGSLVLVRDLVTASTFKIYGTLGEINYDLKHQLVISNYSHIYNCGQVNAYIKLQKQAE